MPSRCEPCPVNSSARSRSAVSPLAISTPSDQHHPVLEMHYATSPANKPGRAARRRYRTEAARADRPAPPRNGPDTTSGTTEAGRRDLGNRGRELRCLLDDHVRVRAGDTERRDTGAARVAVRGPVAALGQQLDGAGLPFHIGRRRVDVERLRQHTVAQRHDHLDHARDTAGGLRVAEVRLDGTEQQRGLPVLPVGGEHGLRLDRVTQRRARAVRLYRVHFGRCQAGVRQRLPDHALLRRAVRRGQAVRRAVLVDRGAAQHGEHLVAVAASVGKSFQQHHTGAFGPAGAVGGLSECLATAVRREPTGRGERGVGVRCGHDRDTTSQCEVAFAVAQGVRGPVHGHERGRAGRVDRDGGAFEAEQVGDAAGQHRRGERGRRVRAGLLQRPVEQRLVVLAGGADEDAGEAALQRRRVEARTFAAPPRRSPGAGVAAGPSRRPRAARCRRSPRRSRRRRRGNRPRTSCWRAVPGPSRDPPGTARSRHVPRTPAPTTLPASSRRRDSGSRCRRSRSGRRSPSRPRGPRPGARHRTVRPAGAVTSVVAVG